MKIEQTICSKLLAKDESGLTLLYKTYSPSLYGIAFNILKIHSFAEDSIQKAFLKIWNKIDQFDSSKSTFFTWMAKIVRNTSIDIKRLKSFKIQTRSESLNLHAHNSSSTYINTSTIDADILIQSLDKKYAFVISHLYLKGYSQSELSKEFNLPLGTIKTRARKGINILRSTFQ